MVDFMKRNGLRLFGLGFLASCAQGQQPGRSVSIVKYNYTDRYLGDVVVDGAWAAGVDAFGGGGDRVLGIMSPSDPSRKVVLKVKWVVADVYDVALNKYSRQPDEPKSTEVLLAWPYPVNPSYLVLHFYPDGHVEAELAADRPKRRIPPPPGYHR